jgi:hypothetical protein
VRELRRARAERAPTIDPLARAIRLLRESSARATPDRRRAAGLVARLLGERKVKPLSDNAGAVAWSATPPSPTAAEALAREVEEVSSP